MKFEKKKKTEPYGSEWMTHVFIIRNKPKLLKNYARKNSTLRIDCFLAFFCQNMTMFSFALRFCCCWVV